MNAHVCAIGKVDDGTLRVCCSTHRHVLCAHHYARTHFVMTAAEYDATAACNANARESDAYVYAHATYVLFERDRSPVVPLTEPERGTHDE